MLSAYVDSSITLTRKILDRPRLIERIRTAIGDTASAHMSCFNATNDKKQLALQLRVTPLGTLEAISTHDQVLGGATG